MPQNSPRTPPPVVESSPKSPPAPDEAAASVVLAPGAERVAPVLASAAAALGLDPAGAVPDAARDPNAPPALVRPLPSPEVVDRIVAEEERRQALAAGPPKAPVRDPLQAGQPTDNIPDPAGLEGASAPAPRVSVGWPVLYTVGEPGEGAYAHSLRLTGTQAGDVRPATVTQVHADGRCDLYVMCGRSGGHPVPDVAPSDAPAGAERSRGKWSPQPSF